MPLAVDSPQQKRRRVVTSCSECHRRKQKCDRKYPCNNCVARKVIGKCVFNGSSTDTRVVESGDRPNAIPIVQEVPTPVSTDDNPRDRGNGSVDLGYSSVSGSNAFMGLQQVLGDKEFQTIRRTQSHAAESYPSSADTQRLLSNLPPRHIIEELAELFFVHVNWHYFIIEKFYFDDMFIRWQSGNLDSIGYLTREELSKELQYFPAVVFQVIASTLQFLPPDAPLVVQSFPNSPALPQRYSNLGQELLSLRSAPVFSFTAIQAEFLRAAFLKNCCKGIEAWHAIGNAVRQAQELGLHRHRDIHQSNRHGIDRTLSLFWYEEYKKRIWINLFAWDSLMSVILGRPRMINMDDCDVKLPIDCNIPKNPSTAVPMTLRSEDNQDITTVSAPLFRYSLAEKIHKMRSHKADRPHPPDYSVVRNLHQEIILQLEELPPSIRPKGPDTSWDTQYPYLPQQREEVLIMMNLLLIALHRPHIVTNVESRKAAIQAALATLDSQQRSFEQIQQHYYQLFGLAFYTVDACLILFIIATLYPPGNHETKLYIDHTLKQAIQRLSILETYNSVAKTGLDVLRRCYKNFQSRQSSMNPFGAELQDAIADSSTIDNIQGTSLSSDPYTTNESLGSDFTAAEFPTDLGGFDHAYWLDQVDQIGQLQQAALQDPNSDMLWEFLDPDQGNMR